MRVILVCLENADKIIHVLFFATASVNILDKFAQLHFLGKVSKDKAGIARSSHTVYSFVFHNRNLGKHRQESKTSELGEVNHKEKY